MSNFYIVTNNPMVKNKYPDVTKFNEEATVEDIFHTCRNSVHLGAILINHPLSGSIKPNQSPYKSLVLSEKKGDLDMFSLRLIEGAIQVLKKFPPKNIKYEDSVLEDFQVIDLDLLDSAIESLPYEYYV